MCFIYSNLVCSLFLCADMFLHKTCIYDQFKSSTAQFINCILSRWLINVSYFVLGLVIPCVVCTVVLILFVLYTATNTFQCFDVFNQQFFVFKGNNSTSKQSSNKIGKKRSSSIEKEFEYINQNLYEASELFFHYYRIANLDYESYTLHSQSLFMSDLYEWLGKTRCFNLRLVLRCLKVCG